MPFFSFHIGGALFVGLGCYLCFRPDTYISQSVYNLFGLEGEAFGLEGVVPEWARGFFCNFFSDMLWSYALAFTVYLILGAFNRSFVSTLFICAVFEVGMEALQKIGIISGTFDFWDIILEVFSTVIALLIIKLHFREKHHEKNQ